MNLHQAYDAKAFCKDAVSNWPSVEPKLLEWTEAIRNSMSTLAEGVRKQSIDAIESFDFLWPVLNCTDAISENAIAIEFNELPKSGFPEASFQLIKEVQKKFSAV